MCIRDSPGAGADHPQGHEKELPAVPAASVGGFAAQRRPIDPYSDYQSPLRSQQQLKLIYRQLLDAYAGSVRRGNLGVLPLVDVYKRQIVQIAGV